MIISVSAGLGMALTAIGLELIPGPNMLYLVSRSIAQGRAAGLVSLVGTGLGFVVDMALADFGLTVVFVAVPWLYIGFKVAGVAYLGYLAWRAVRPGGSGRLETRSVRPASRLRLLTMGLVTNLLNPKAAMIYLALIPQFVDPTRGQPLAQGLVLGGIQISVSMAMNALIVIGAGSIAGVLAKRPAWVRWQRRVTAALLGAAAVYLATEVPKRALP